ncbi:hypothetical protein C8F01DRAFT_1370355 [Mycena amicta]|nr:hypothetical protein C8F01DRAFT_1370355 [Mycena amicta]
MPPSRSAPAAATLLVSVMKENAELKSALETKSRDIQAAEHALMLLINENQDLGRQAEAANLAAVEGQTPLKELTEGLQEAGGEIEKLLADLKDKAKRIQHLEEKVDRLSEETHNSRGRRTSKDGHRRERERSSRRDQADWHHTSKRDESSSSRRQSRFSAPHRRSRSRAHSRDEAWEPERSNLSSWKTSYICEDSGKNSHSTSAEKVDTKIKTEEPPSEPLSHRNSSSSLWSSASNNKRVTQRTILNQYMSSLPLPKTVARSGPFQENQAVQTADASHKIFKDFPSKRTALHLPGRTLWCQGTQLHAIAHAPTHEYDNGKWKPHLHLSSLAATSAEVDLFANHREMVHYAGVYRVLSFRGVDGYGGGGRNIPMVEISHDAIYRAMNLNPGPLNLRENNFKIRRNPAFPQGKPKTECFGLQYIGYDEDVQRRLRERFIADSDTKLEDRIGGLGKRKRDNDSGEEGGDARGKNKKNASGERLYQNKVWVRRAHAGD